MVSRHLVKPSRGLESAAHHVRVMAGVPEHVDRTSAAPGHSVWVFLAGALLSSQGPRGGNHPPAVLGDA
jgi:hypothetical protein